MKISTGLKAEVIEYSKFNASLTVNFSYKRSFTLIVWYLKYYLFSLSTSLNFLMINFLFLKRTIVNNHTLLTSQNE